MRNGKPIDPTRRRALRIVVADSIDPSRRPRLYMAYSAISEMTTPKCGSDVPAEPSYRSKVSVKYYLSIWYRSGEEARKRFSV